MSQKHTPGPWRYLRENGSPTTGQHMIAGAKPGYLAEVRDCGSEDVEANARLIAAAPDMYEALKALYNSIDSCVELNPKVLFKARAAIAKADEAK